MKPCSKNRKWIAWLALNALEVRQAEALREHLAHCAECRRYAEEISNLTKTLASAAPESELEASESFHRKVGARLKAIESNSLLEELRECLCGSTLSWRVALPTVVVLGIMIVAMFALRPHPVVTPSAVSTIQVSSSTSSASDLAPTLANYQMVASQSLEKLEEMLTRQGNVRLPPAPVPTIASRQLDGAAF